MFFNIAFWERSMFAFLKSMSLYASWNFRQSVKQEAFCLSLCCLSRNRIIEWVYLKRSIGIDWWTHYITSESQVDIWNCGYLFHCGEQMPNDGKLMCGYMVFINSLPLLLLLHQPLCYDNYYYYYYYYFEGVDWPLMKTMSLTVYEIWGLLPY